jgi:isoleucyl-tRNA synthetase
MHLMADGLARLLAPILPVTADDLWRNLPGQRSESVHLERFAEVAGLADDSIMATWDRLLAVRADVNAALEEKRQAKEIGTSLSARVTIAASGPVAALLERHRDDLPTLFIVSEVELIVGATEGADEVRITVGKAGGVKCDRCWRFVPAVRDEPEWAGICDRCLDALGAAAPR